jgi:hypothetical protein
MATSMRAARRPERGKGGPREEDSWVAQPGSQVLFLGCPIFEVLYEGTRGPGKTDTLLMDFAQHVGMGHGPAWRGVLFRQTHPQLADVIAKSKRWFPLIFGEDGCEFSESKSTWSFADGEQLLLRQMRVPDDYWNYHGHEYPWIAFEELTNWADDVCYKRMMSCSRSSARGMPRKYRATCNPYGRGHNWVKARFGLPHMRGRVIRTPGEPDRVAIHGHIDENRVLLRADPEYISKIRAAARNPSELAAWLDGSWDIVAGGMFDDLWQPAIHLLQRFRVPRSWRVDRSLDWGTTRPFSVGWWAKSDGSDILLPAAEAAHGLPSRPERRMRTVAGDLFRIGEWYGWTGKPNEGLKMTAARVAEGIRSREVKLGLGGRVMPGPADNQIFSADPGVPSTAREMESAGVRWLPADKGPVQGWDAIRSMLEQSANPGRHRPGMFVVEEACPNFVRTFPTLPRDDNNLDDVDTEAEDHVGDEVRYRVRWRGGSGIARGTF